MIRRVRPIWPVPPEVRAFTTTRHGGVSKGPFASLNLGERCGDDDDAVAENRARFALALPGAPGWVRQVHGNRVVRRESMGDTVPEADGLVCMQPGLPCTVLTADCLPVLFCDLAGTRVAAAHAGWRGLAAGVLQAVVDELDTDPAELMAWLGPGISAAAYEVGPEVEEAILNAFPRCRDAFAQREGRRHADLYAIARRLLAAAGVEHVHGGGYCTHADRERFYSHRRDGRTGRMATTIWLREDVGRDSDPEDEGPV